MLQLLLLVTHRRIVVRCVDGGRVVVVSSSRSVGLHLLLLLLLFDRSSSGSVVGTVGLESSRVGILNHWLRRIGFAHFSLYGRHLCSVCSAVLDDNDDVFLSISSLKLSK